VDVERTGLIKVGGKDATVVGDDIRVGQPAPNFSAQATDWSSVKGLADTPGKVRTLAAVQAAATSALA
jgi:peroxiredoxin